ncbi:L,D-transpeptidase family protein [Pontibacter litorisediminis]|uniref:L,D-transpeptidase family protein n=1 Tax=Pontibacter litorisediminis TaxID=1846260 RepID=UPI0023EB2303|nr:L,D-transpeptidase family protein [Pontibacter litorisediminis]
MKTIFKWSLAVVTVGLLAYNLFPEQELTPGTAIDRLIVYKSERKLLAYADNQLVKTYTISLGRKPDGRKEFEGDRRTPEGTYTINDKNPNSAYHKNLGISYPSADDIAHAKKLGKPVGGAIKIHGLRNGTSVIGKLHRWADWTQGCIAVTNDEISELYEAVAVGTPIEIHP